MRRHAMHTLFRSISTVKPSESGQLSSATANTQYRKILTTAIGPLVEPVARPWRLAAVSAGLATAAALAWGASTGLNDTVSAQCAAEIPLPSANPKGGQFLDEFTRWLDKRGCDTAAIEIRPCKENPTAGLGVFAADPAFKDRLKRSWWRLPFYWLLGKQDVVVASFPLTSVVTARTIVEDKKLGPMYQQLLDSGAVDERQLISVFLLVERIRGPDSAWQPWITMLPQSFRSPLFFGKVELDEIKGTTLLRATEVLRSSLKGQWQELAPLVERLLRSAGTPVQGMSATFEDYLWAHAVFWSRSISFPEPNACPDPLSRAVKPQEGLVPGLDFCNHSSEARSRWSVWNPVGRQGDIPTAVSLIASRSAAWRDGEEVTINYGDKSNEELMLQYGFAMTRNPSDALMLVCPPLGDGPAALGAKSRLLQREGLQPQLFLTAAGLESANPKQRTVQQKLGFSDELWKTLSIILMPPEQAAARADSLAKQQDPKEAGAPHSLTSGVPLKDAAEEAALTKQKLATVLRLLEGKIAEMEDPQHGTSSLENDIRLLEKADLGIAPTLRNCLLYRASQKRIARGYRAAISEALRDLN